MNNIKHFLAKFIITFLACLVLQSCSNNGANINSKTTKEQEAQNVVEVAILTPLTEDDAEYYTEINKMIKFGLADAARTRIHVTSFDSSNPTTLTDSIEKIAEQNIDIIIGPFFSGDTEMVATRFKNKKVSIITLSNNPVLADKNVYVFGHAPMKQLEYLVEHFLNDQYNNYILMLPSGRYSSSVTSILKEMIVANNAVISRVEYYNNNPEDIARAVKLVSDTVDSLNEVDLNIKKPVIIIADDSSILNILYSNIYKYNLDKKAIIAGDSRVNINTKENIDITYTGSMVSDYTRIVKKSKKMGITHLGFMHELAYDAGKIVAELIGDHYNRGEFIEKISSMNFIGMSGRVHFVDSIATRQYEILSRTNGKISALSVKNDNMSQR